VVEPSSAEANTTVTVRLTLDGVTDEGTSIPVPDSFTVFSCTAPPGWLCQASELGTLPAVVFVQRSGAVDELVTIELELRTPTAAGDYAFGEDVLTITGGFAGGPTSVDALAGDDPVVGSAEVEDVPPVGGDANETAPSIVAALLLLVVAVAAYRAGRQS
jgi:hypothetical protein